MDMKEELRGKVKRKQEKMEDPHYPTISLTIKSPKKCFEGSETVQTWPNGSDWSQNDLWYVPPPVDIDATSNTHSKALVHHHGHDLLRLKLKKLLYTWPHLWTWVIPCPMETTFSSFSCPKSFYLLGVTVGRVGRVCIGSIRKYMINGLCRVKPFTK